MKSIVINGLTVEISLDRVRIFDTKGDLSKKGALQIVKYLHSEAFVEGQKVLLEIVTNDEI